jgi:hypothetical protein
METWSVHHDDVIHILTMTCLAHAMALTGHISDLPIDYLHGCWSNQIMTDFFVGRVDISRWKQVILY